MTQNPEPPMGGGYPPPPPAGGPPAGNPPPNNLVWGILTTIFCCLPLGIASIVFAAQVNGKWQAGDFAGAQESAAKAKRFAIWGAVAGIILLPILVYIQIQAAETATTGV